MRGHVASVAGFGAFVDLGAGVMGLVHVSELSHSRISRVEDVVKEGDVLVLYGLPDGLARAEARLLIGDGRHRERSAAVERKRMTVRADEAPPARRRAHRPNA